MRLVEIKTTHGKQVYTRIPLDQLKQYEEIILDYHRTKLPIYRGMGHSTTNMDNVLLGNGNVINRKSVDGNNIYTLLIDNLPSWKDYPQRRKSFMCTTNYGRAKSYGKAFVAIPLENQKIAICSDDDFWQSGRNGLSGLFLTYGPGGVKQLSTIIEQMAERIITYAEAKKLKIPATPNIKEAAYGMNFTALAKILRLIKFAATNESFKPIIGKMVNLDHPIFKEADDPYMLKGLNAALDPALNDMELLDANSLTKSGQFNFREVWFTGQALFIAKKTYDDYIMKITS